MGTFAAGHMLDPHTGRPIAAQAVRVLAWPTDLPVTPDDGPVVTGARGGYSRFTVAGQDSVSLVASDGTVVGPLASIEAQEAAANAAPFLEDAAERLDELESRSGTSVANNVATFDDLPAGPADGQSWIVRSRPGHAVPHPALYTWSETTGAWSEPVSITGAATSAAIGDALSTSGPGRDAADARAAVVVRDRTRIWDITAYGVPTDGTTLAHTALTDLIAQMSPGDTLFVPPSAVVRLGAGVTIDKPLVIDAPGTFHATAALDMLTLTSAASGSTVRRLNGTGPGGATQVRLLRLLGTLGNRVSADIYDVHGENMYGTLWAEFGDAITTHNVTTKSCHYHGQMFLSCSNVAVHNPVTHGLTGLSNSNCYPVAFSRSTGSLATYPRSEHCRVYGGESRNTPWEAIDTHGGRDIVVYDHHSVNTAVGVAFVPSPNGAGVPTYAPVDCWAYNCTADSGVSDGSARPNYILLGTTTEQASGGFVSSKGIGGGANAGRPANGTGAVEASYTDGFTIRDMQLIEPSPAGVNYRTRNYGAVLDGLTVQDAWSSSYASHAVCIAENENTVDINRLKLKRGNKTAAYVNTVNIGTPAATTGVQVTLGSTVDQSTADVQMSGMAGKTRGGFFGTPAVARPTAVPVTAAGVHAALVQLGLITG